MSIASFDHLVEVSRQASAPAGFAQAPQRPRDRALAGPKFQERDAFFTFAGDLAPSRGIGFSLALSLPLWAAIYAFVKIVIHHI